MNENTAKNTEAKAAEQEASKTVPNADEQNFNNQCSEWGDKCRPAFDKNVSTAMFSRMRTTTEQFSSMSTVMVKSWLQPTAEFSYFPIRTSQKVFTILPLSERAKTKFIPLFR